VLRFLAKLFSSKARPAEVLPSNGLFDRFMEIPERGFYGQFRKSPSGRYVIAWRDANDQGTHGGARASGKGRYVLLESGRVVCEGRLERPHDGKVADNGVFVLNDWRFFSNELRGTFCAFRPNGEQIICQLFNANLFNNGISRDGRYGACQTCNSVDENDSSVLAIFNLQEGRELARWRPESGWANGYRFAADGVHVALEYPQKSPLTYTLTGQFIDRQKWLDEAIARGDANIIEQALREIGKNPDPELTNRLIAGLDLALANVRDNDPRTKAYVFRLKGECQDACSNSGEALRCFDMALALNPKVGVRRRAEQLRKMLGR
jgi:hypothetical protein